MYYFILSLCSAWAESDRARMEKEYQKQQNISGNSEEYTANTAKEEDHQVDTIHDIISGT